MGGDDSQKLWPRRGSDSSPGHSRPSGVLQTQYSTQRLLFPAVFQHHARRLSETFGTFDLITLRQGYLRALTCHLSAIVMRPSPADSGSSTLRDLWRVEPPASMRDACGCLTMKRCR